ncbi:uncharacterized protein LOC142230228 isoform X2 [Haematobia irritans]|uniref:uncharacterized protein LOC142230228 isoform X2 n=1 Tax=Haematobia irritans TaxID=7368 RepID=UPI003F5095C0
MSFKNQQYLSVDDRDYYHKASPSLSANRHKHKTRGHSSSPLPLGYESSRSMASTPDLSSVSEMSFDRSEATSSTDSSPSLNKKRHKSIDNLCFGTRNRKKLHRKVQVTEMPRMRFYTDSQTMSPHKKFKHRQIPVLRIPTDDEANYNSDGTGKKGIGALLKQTIKVTSASMGFRTLSAERLASYSPRPLTEDVKRRFSRSTSSVSTLAQLPTDSLGSSSMAPLQTHTEAQSVQCLNTTESYDTKDSINPQQTTKRSLQQQLSIPESLEATSIGCATSSEYSSARSLKNSSASLAPLQSVPSSSSLRSISPSRRSASSNSSSTAKHEQSPAASTAAGAVAATTSSAAAGTSGSSSSHNITPPEKEKKRKEVSSSRVKKFQRHFSQVSQDEKLINYFSCALVSDILLQGHLYITDQHFAFYSNVFGYVTKVVIPTSSVTKISKEKTAKIIPNAVGVATADERHVFGSFISREAAFRLMCSVCPPLGTVEILPKDPASIEISEEYSVEDDSSCSISGNESPAQATDNANSTNENQTILRRSVGNSSLSIADSSGQHKLRHSDIPLNAKTATNSAASIRASAPPAAGSAALHYVNGGSGAGGGGIGHVIMSSINGPATAIGCPGLDSHANLTFIAGTASTTTSATTTPTPSTSSSPTTIFSSLPQTKAYQILNKFRTLSNKLMVNVKFPTEIHVVYLGAMLTVLLAVFTIFLLYRILDIEAKTNTYRSPIEFNWQSANNDDIFAEALRFQKQLQVKSTEEAQNILKTNLDQIAKVRRSLETLSMLIHDRSSSFGSTTPDDSD